MENNVINGGDLMLFLADKSLAFATSHKLSVNVETVETTSKDNGGKWVSKAARKISWNLSSENLYIEKGDTAKAQSAFGDLFDLMVARTPVKAVFAKASNAEVDEVPAEGGWLAAETGRYEGDVIITSLEANAPNGDNATYSVSFEGVGELKHTAEL